MSWTRTGEEAKGGGRGGGGDKDRKESDGKRAVTERGGVSEGERKVRQECQLYENTGEQLKMRWKRDVSMKDG